MAQASETFIIQLPTGAGWPNWSDVEFETYQIWGTGNNQIDCWGSGVAPIPAPAASKDPDGGWSLVVTLTPEPFKGEGLALITRFQAESDKTVANTPGVFAAVIQPGSTTTPR